MQEASPRIFLGRSKGSDLRCLARGARPSPQSASVNGPPSNSLIAGARAILMPPLGIIPFAYLAAIAGAEFATALADARWGATMHAFLLAALLIHASLIPRHPHHKLLLALSLAPLIRVLSLSMPLENVELIYWYALIGAPLLLAAFIVARTLRLSRRNLGLTLGSLRVQALVAPTGIAFGLAEYFILKPEPLIDGLSLGQVWLPALILLIGTGFNEELVFRGVMQSASSESLGKLSILYVTVVFAVLHIGYKSVVDVAFVFAVGLFFAWVVARTSSLLGVSLSHGATNIALYLVVPFLGIAATTAPSISVQDVGEPTYDVSQEVRQLQTVILPPASPAIATPEPMPEAPPAAPAPPAPEPGSTEIHIVETGESLASIAEMYGTTVDELLRLNDLPEPSLLYAGQSIVVPRRAPSPPPDEGTETIVHVVQQGETLSAIAESYDTTVEAILELNDLPDPNIIPVGESVLVPQPP